MNVLSFDTSSTLLDVAFRNARGTRRVVEDIGLHHVERLMPAVAELVAGAQVELVVCPKGPGSFTGLRVGLSTAKGLAAGFGCPFVAVPTLEALATPLAFLEDPVVPVIDARKRRLYCAIFHHGRRVTPDLDITPEELISRLGSVVQEGSDRHDHPQSYERVILTGPHAAALAMSLPEFSDAEGERTVTLLVDPRARSGISLALLDLGVERFRAGLIAADDESPEYVRESDAEIRVQAPGSGERP